MRLALAMFVIALLAAVPAAAKNFEPGDLRLCNAQECVAITDQRALDAVASFYYGNGRLRRVTAPRLGVPYFELRFTNGYVTGIVATASLERFLSYGVNTSRFVRGRWYRVPAAAATELRRLGGSLEPLRLTRRAIRSSH